MYRSSAALKINAYTLCRSRAAYRSIHIKFVKKETKKITDSIPLKQRLSRRRLGWGGGVHFQIIRRAS